MNKHIHIVTHEVPWPVDFGGVFDLFYKIKSLHQKGIKIHLHCFTKKMEEHSILNRYCESVHYYERKKHFSLSHFLLPFIVQSRNDKALLENLQKDNYPILLEGIHCTYFLYKHKLQDRNVFVRLHNVEYLYYKKLAVYEKNFFRKAYFYIESLLLFRYEKKLAPHTKYLCVANSDKEFYQKRFKPLHIEYLPVFVPWSTVSSPQNLGNFCLYHGNLSINENDEAAKWLLQSVFAKIKIPIVIAGKNPSSSLIELSHSYQHSCVVANPTDFELDDLIKKAQINILPSLNNTGVKLKILNALFNGRHVLVNPKAIEGTSLKIICEEAETADDFIKLISILYQDPFEDFDIEKRSKLLGRDFNNQKNASILEDWITQC